MIMVHARLLFLSLGDKSALDSDCINIGPVLGFPAKDVKVPVGVAGQQQVKFVALEDFAKVSRLHTADASGEFECFSRRIEGPSDVFGVVNVAVKVDGTVRDSELLGFGVGLLRLEPFEVCRDCLGAGRQEVEAGVLEVSGAVAAFLQYHPFAAGLEEFAAILIFADKVSRSDRTGMPAWPGSEGNPVVPLGEFSEINLDV